VWYDSPDVRAGVAHLFDGATDAFIRSYFNPTPVWRAKARWLELSYQADYRQPSANVEVNTSAQAGEEKPRRLHAGIDGSNGKNGAGV